MRFAILAFLAFALSQCSIFENTDEPENQGHINQTPAGQIIANLTSRGLSKDPKIGSTSAVVLYLYKKKDYSDDCTSAGNKEKCEDLLIMRNERIDSLGFTNEPGFFGYDPDYNSYSPQLIAEPGSNYSAVKPPDPPGFSDPDVWQCIKNPYPSNPNYGKYECGINNHPIRYFNSTLSRYAMQVYAAGSKGYPSAYLVDYNLFNSLNHPIVDGERYYAYFGVHYNAMKALGDSEDRIVTSSNIFKRPLLPDLVSPRIAITLKLLPEGPYDTAGSVYDIPDYATWYDPIAGCRPATAAEVSGQVYFSEIMWMGSSTDTGVTDSEDEYIELYNNSASAISISGWEIAGAGSSTSSITIANCTTIPAGGVITLGESSGKAFKTHNLVNVGITLTNSGETLTLKDASGSTVNTLGTNCTNWGNRGKNTATKASMRLGSVTSFQSDCTNWVTTSVNDTNYSTASANLNDTYRALTDVGTGTIATPGYKGP